jgi:NAD+ synthase
MQMDEKGIVDTDFSDRQKEVFRIYKRFNRTNHHKMVPIPVCEIPNSLK